MTEAEAWRTIGEAFDTMRTGEEKRPDLTNHGLCNALQEMQANGEITVLQHTEMYSKVWAEAIAPGQKDGAYLSPRPGYIGGSELRAGLAYLFAEEAAL